MIVKLATTSRGLRSISLFDPRKIPSWDNPIPPFHALTNLHYDQVMRLDSLSVYLNKMFWIPRFFVQKTLSTRFLSEIEKLKRVTDWQEIDTLALTQLCLIEATRDTTYEMGFDYQAEPSRRCLFHGKINILLYNSLAESGYLPIIPVMLPISDVDRDYGVSFERFSMVAAVGAGLWSLQRSQERNESVSYVRAIQTNGLAWRFFEVHESYVKKTKLFYVGADKERDIPHVKLVEETMKDLEFLRNVIGLTRFMLGIEENIPAITSGSEVRKIVSNHKDTAVKLIETKSQLDMFDVKAIEEVSRAGKLLAGDNKEDIAKITDK